MSTPAPTKLTHTDIVNKANKLAAEILAWTDIQQVCREEGMSEEDAERVRKQVDKIAERLRRA
jgi:ribosomal protein S13